MANDKTETSDKVTLVLVKGDGTVVTAEPSKEKK